MYISDEQTELGYYKFVSSLDMQRDSDRQALYFTRVFSDLANRVLAARAVQNGRDVEYLPSLRSKVLQAYLANGAQALAAALERDPPADCDSATMRLLAPLAQWLAESYDYKRPETSSVQVWVSPPGKQLIRLFGQPTIERKAELPTLGPAFELLDRNPYEDYLVDCAPGAVALMAHYDVHGLSMMALTLRYLREIGVRDPLCEMSFEWTGDIGKLWKRAVPKCLDAERALSAVIMVDCPVHSRKPQHTLKGIAKLDNNPQSRLLMIDHHPDTFMLAPQMQHERLQMVLTDVFSCGLTRHWGQPEREIMALGALSDKVPEVDAAFPPADYPELHQSVTEYHRWHLHFSPTPKAFKDQGLFPLQPLWEALADGARATPELSRSTLGELPEEAPVQVPEVAICGSLLLVTERLQAVGRAWYSLLEDLMLQHQVGYALAVRLLDRRRANFLFLTRWQSTHLPPGRYFVPEHYNPHLLGHPGALWADLDKAAAADFITETAGALNDYFGTPAPLDAAIAKIKENILSAEPVPGEAGIDLSYPVPEAEEGF